MEQAQHAQTVPTFPTEFPDNDRLAREITLLAGQINAANHRLLTLIAAFDDSKGWSGGGTVRSCAHWLNWQCGIALGAAREKVRVAHSLAQLPQIDAAFAAGEISYSKVRAMTRVATPENEDYLLMIARHGTASHVEQAVGKYRSVRRGLDGKTEKQQAEARELVYYQDDNGQWVIHARLAPEAGELVIKALEAAVTMERKNPIDRVLEKQQRENVSAETSELEPQLIEDAPPPTYRQARADALDACELVRHHPHATTILIDQGLDDGFLADQLQPEHFEAACAEAGQALVLRRHPGYDHGYFFIQSFIEDHLRHHAEQMLLRN